MFIGTLFDLDNGDVKVVCSVDSDAIILGASTIVFSGVVSGVVTYFLNRSKERSEFLRGKLETLFAKISDFHDDFGQALFRAVSTIKRKLTWEEAMAERDKAMAGIASKADAYPAADMLISLYFPDLLPQLRRCKKAADRAFQLQLDLRALTEAGRVSCRVGQKQQSSRPVICLLARELISTEMSHQA